MKKLSDYTGNDAIELWGDLLIPLTKIIQDKEIRKAYRFKPMMEFAKSILTLHAKEAEEILLRIDPTPLNGINTIIRVVALIKDFENSEELSGFFASAEQVQTENAFSGLHTVNTVDAEN